MEENYQVSHPFSSFRSSFVVPVWWLEFFSPSSSSSLKRNARRAAQSESEYSCACAVPAFSSAGLSPFFLALSVAVYKHSPLFRD